MKSLALRLKASARRASRRVGAILRLASLRLQQPPHPWGTLIVGLIGLMFAAISATFAGLNYFKVPRTRAVLLLDRFDPMYGTIEVAGLQKQNAHNLRLWLSNTGQASATLHSVTISTEFYDAPLTSEKEAERMDYVAKNKDTIGSNFNAMEFSPGQKLYFNSHALFSDQIWSDFNSQEQLLYQFAVVTFTDELSSGREITMEICVRVAPDLTWVHCVSGHNRTVR